MKEIKIIDILKKDLICVLFASFAVSTWIVFLIVIVAIIFWGKCPIPETNFYITTRDIPFVIFMIFSANLLSFLIILFKFKYYKTILIRSIPVKGNINSVSKLDEYGMIDINLSYEFHGKLYNRVQRIQGNEFNGSIKTGDVVTVSIDPRKPKRFLIQEIYKKI